MLRLLTILNSAYSVSCSREINYLVVGVVDGFGRCMVVGPDGFCERKANSAGAGAWLSWTI